MLSKNAKTIAYESFEQVQQEEPPLRIALMATPRSGGTWLRCLLDSIYSAKRVESLYPADLDWTALPKDCILHTHWYRSDSVLSELKRNHFRKIVVLSRHPLDVLISMLQYAPYVAETCNWFKGGRSNESSLLGPTPCSPIFLEFSTGNEAKAMLSISREWWHTPGVFRVRYEDLVQDTAGELNRLVEALGLKVRGSIEEAITTYTMDNLRSLDLTRRFHFWKGKAGLWRNLIIAKKAHEIATAHRETFSELDYICDPDENLVASQAEANWFKFVFEAVKRDLRDTRADLIKSQNTLVEMQMHYDKSQKALAEAMTRLAAFGNIGVNELEFINWSRRISLEFPKIFSMLKWVFRLIWKFPKKS